LRVSTWIKSLWIPIPVNPRHNASSISLYLSALLFTRISQAMPSECLPGFSFLASIEWLGSLYPEVIRNGKPHLCRRVSSNSRNCLSIRLLPVSWQSNSSSLKYFTRFPINYRRLDSGWRDIRSANAGNVYLNC